MASEPQVPVGGTTLPSGWTDPVARRLRRREPSRPSGEATSRAALEPNWFEKFTAAMNNRLYTPGNWLQQIFTGRPYFSAADRRNAAISKRYAGSLPTELGGYAGTLSNPLTMSVMAAAPEVEAVEPIEAGTAYVEKRLGPSIPDRLKDDAIRSAFLSQIRPTEERATFGSRAGAALKAAAAGAPWAMLGFTPKQARELEEAAWRDLREEGHRILPPPGRIARGIERGTRVLGEDFTHYIFNRANHHAIYRVPKRGLESASEQSLERGIDVMPSLDPEDLHDAVYQSVLGQVRLNGGITPWQYLDLSRRVHGADNFDADRLPPEALAEKRAAQLAIQRTLNTIPSRMAAGARGTMEFPP